MKIEYPSGGVGFVEYKRAFTAAGSFSSGDVPDDAALTVTLADEKGNELRRVRCEKKYGDIFAYHPGLTSYPEERDPGREKMREFGFPELAVEDENDPERSLCNAEIKAWYGEGGFKAVIVSATDVSHGAAADDGMHFSAKDGTPYGLLPMGEYTLKAELSHKGRLLEGAEKKIIIGRRKDQLICRFNPEDHKKRISEWCDEMGFSVISDPLPGYLDSYLGDWEYHKGLLKMYRANDLPLFETARVRMFVYLTDPGSTSYETELAYLMKTQAVGNPERFFAYHYDIGEAVVGKGTDHERNGIPVEFPAGQYLSLCRVDIVNDEAEEGLYHTDGRALVRALYDTSRVKIRKGEKFAVMGVMKPWQGNPEDFVLRDDNTFEIKNPPSYMRYEVRETSSPGIPPRVYKRSTSLKREAGASVYEFYNLFTTDDLEIGKTYAFSVCCIDGYEKKTPAESKLLVEVV